MERLSLLMGTINTDSIVAELRESIEEIIKFQGRVGESADTLLSCIEKYEEIAAKAEEILIYCQLLIDLDTKSYKARDLYSMAEDISLRAIEATQFIHNEIKDISVKELNNFYESNKKLLNYKNFLQKLKFNSPSQNEVFISYLESVGQIFEEIFQSFIYQSLPYPDILLDGKTINITWTNIKKLLKHKDRNFRKQVYEKLFGSFQKFSDSLSLILNGHVKKEVYLAKLNGKETVFESVLDKNQLKQKMFTLWIKKVHEHIPELQQLWKIRTTHMNIDTFHYYDMYATVVPEHFQKVTFNQAKEIIFNASIILGKEYQEALKTAFDYVIHDTFFEITYATNIFNRHPVGLIQFNGTLSDVLILAHEVGHLVHMIFINQHNTFINSEVLVLPSEIAALTSEVIVLQHLIEISSNLEEKQYLLHMLLHKFHGYIFRQTLLMEFEKKIYAYVEDGMQLSGEFLNNTYNQLQSKYYGETFGDLLSGNEWISISHLFSTFYLMAYPLAFVGAINLIEKIRTKQISEKEYMTFLGTSSYVGGEELFKKIGILKNIPEDFQFVFNLYKNFLYEYELLLNK
ncbi:TPA: hypothetical protein QCY03_003497 [Bacillus tropicus]|nr:hypothetical protein [Bacillus tropicus]